MTRLVGALAALLLVLTACGEDGPSAAEKRHGKAVASIAKGLQENSDVTDSEQPVFTDSDAECAGTTVVDRMGAEALVDQEVLDEDLSLVAIPDRPSRKLAKALVHAIADCVGIVEFSLRTMRAVMGGMAQAGDRKYDDSDKTWKRVRKCARRQIPEKAAKKAALRNPNGAVLTQPMLQRLQKCGEAALG